MNKKESRSVSGFLFLFWFISFFILLSFKPQRLRLITVCILWPPLGFILRSTCALVRIEL
jgi:hypothetical protein